LNGPITRLYGSKLVELALVVLMVLVRAQIPFQLALLLKCIVMEASCIMHTCKQWIVPLPAGLRDPAGRLVRRCKLTAIAISQQLGNKQQVLQLVKELSDQAAQPGKEDVRTLVQVLLGDAHFEASSQQLIDSWVVAIYKQYLQVASLLVHLGSRSSMTSLATVSVPESHHTIMMFYLAHGLELISYP
jgi:hypothetical protein